MKKQIEWLSQCCNHTFTEPGWPESDFCGSCKDHSGAEAVITYEQFLEAKALESNAAVVAWLKEQVAKLEEMFNEMATLATNYATEIDHRIAALSKQEGKV